MALRVDRQKKKRRSWVVVVVGLVALVWGLNYFMISRPVAAALAADQRLAPMALGAHLRWFVDPGTLAFDLGGVGVADTTDLFRGLLAAAKALSDGSWGIPGSVTLSRSGDLVYTIAGEDLRRTAHDFPLSRRPVQVLGTLIQSLRGPDGKPLGPETTLESAARRWAVGHP